MTTNKICIYVYTYIYIYKGHVSGALHALQERGSPLGVRYNRYNCLIKPSMIGYLTEGPAVMFDAVNTCRDASEQSEPSEPNGEPVWAAIHIRQAKICT